MDKRNDGGPAFPSEHDEPVINFLGHERIVRCYTEGLSLRDYFAAKAMPEIYQRVDIGGFEKVASLSYQMADAMLKAREIKPE